MRNRTAVQARARSVNQGHNRRWTRAATLVFIIAMLAGACADSSPTDEVVSANVVRSAAATPPPADEESSSDEPSD